MKITQADINQAVNNLALPDFVLKKVQEQKKIFDKAIKNYKFNPILKYTEDKNKKAERINKLKEKMDYFLPSIFTVFYQYKGKLGSEEIEKIVDDVRKKLSSLKKDYTFDQNKISKSTKSSQSITVPKHIVKTFKKLKKDFDAAIKNYGPTSASKTLQRKTDSYDELKSKVQVPIGCIYAANKYYSDTAWAKELKKIVDDVYKTVTNLEKKKGVLFDNTTDLKNFMINAASENTEGKIPTIDFDLSTTFKGGYENLLEKCFKIYSLQYKWVKSEKAKVKETVNQKLSGGNNEMFTATAKKSHTFLKQFKNVETEIDKIIKESSKYQANLSKNDQVSLRREMKKIQSPQIIAVIDKYESDLKKITYPGKFGGDPGARFRNIDFILNKYADVISSFINVFSNSASSSKVLLDAISNLKKEALASQKIHNYKKAKYDRYQADNSKILEYIEKLNELSVDITKGLDGWSEKYENFIETLKKFKAANSTSGKLIAKLKLVLQAAAWTIGLLAGSKSLVL